jgi:hypothetical protein
VPATAATAIVQRSVAKWVTKIGGVLLAEKTRRQPMDVTTIVIASRSFEIAEKFRSPNRFLRRPCRIKVAAPTLLP